MFGYNCSFCGSDTSKCYSDTNYLCPNCVEIKKIIDLYSTDEVVETLKFIYLREPTPIKNRRDLVKCSDASHPVKRK